MRSGAVGGTAPWHPCNPLTGREIRFRKTCKTERAAQIELGKLLAMAQAGRQPDSDVTVAQLLGQYVSTAGRGAQRRERADTGAMTETESLIAEVRQLRADVARLHAAHTAVHIRHGWMRQPPPPPIPLEPPPSLPPI